MDISFLNGTSSKVTHGFDLLTPSSSSPELPNRKPSLEDQMDDSQISDPRVNTAALPENHPIHYLHEAREYFKDNRPPFVIRRDDNLTTRALIIPTKDGRRPAVPDRVEAKAKLWNDKLMFWTLDLDNKRYIVKAFGGAPRAGMKYRYWAGPGKEFDEKPLAYTDLDTHANIPPYHDVPAAANGESLYQEDTNDEDYEVDFNLHNRDTARLTKAKKRKAKKNISRGGQHNENKANAAAFARQILDQCPTPSNPEKTTRFTNNSTISRMEGSEKPAQKQYQQGRQSEILPRASGDMELRTSPRKRRKTDIPYREVGWLNDNSAPLTTQPRPEIQQTAASDSSSPSDSSSDEETSQTEVHTTPNQLPQQSKVPKTTLSEFKQTRTILLVRLAPAAEFQPLKLLECPTVQAFSSNILGLWGVAEDEVEKITVNFNWMDVNYRKMAMVLNRNPEAHFQYLLDQVDECPGWMEEKPKCLLDVDIVLK
ncbi:hypothetical protein ACLMJK_008916 [Lecanora helva]